jgi:hypothetical protein
MHLKNGVLRDLRKSMYNKIIELPISPFQARHYAARFQSDDQIEASRTVAFLSPPQNFAARKSFSVRYYVAQQHKRSDLYRYRITPFLPA